MYALIFDERDPAKPLKQVISVHRSRRTAEQALAKRMRKLEKRVWECDTRIVWIEGAVKAGDLVGEKQFSTWRPGEAIPEGELYSDTD
jgi:hypothetical protein